MVIRIRAPVADFPGYDTRNESGICMLMVYMEAPRGTLGGRSTSLARLFENGVKVGAGEESRAGSARGCEQQEVRVPGFTHLHTVSGFSMRYGASHPERLAERAAERGMDALALTDRDTLAGAVRFAKAARGAGVRPLFGVDLAVRRNAAGPGGRHGPAAAHSGARRGLHRRVRRPGPSSSPGTAPPAGPSCAGWSPPPTPGRTGPPSTGPAPAALARQPRGDGLTVLLGPDSEVGRALAAGRPDRAARLLAPWRERVRRRAAPGGRPPRPHRHRPRLAAAGRPYRRLRRRAGRTGRAQQRRPLRRPRPGPGRRRPGRGPPAGPRRPAQRPRSTAESAGSRARTPWPTPPSGSPRPPGCGATPRTGCSRRPRSTAAACLVDPEDDLGIGTVHFPEPRLVGAGRRTAQRVLRLARPPPAWCCAATTGDRALLGADAPRAATSSPTTASPRTS